MNTPTPAVMAADGTTVVLWDPFDAHTHWRKLPLMNLVAQDMVPEYRGALVMPNPDPPITTLPIAQAYLNEIDVALRTAGTSRDFFDILLTHYLSKDSTVPLIREGRDRGLWVAVKSYPFHGSTNSAYALEREEDAYPLFEWMQEAGMPYLRHGEVVGEDIDPFDAEAIDFETRFLPLRRKFPKLRIVLEHITTADVAEYVAQADNYTFATLCPQHLLKNRSAIFQSGSFAAGNFRRGSRPKLVCWPLLKDENNRKRLVNALPLGIKNGRFGLGSDRAAHPPGNKYCDHGCGGCYPGPNSLSQYAMALEQAVAGFTEVGLTLNEAFNLFACRNIAQGVYKLPARKTPLRIRLTKDTAHPWTVETTLDYGVEPFLGGEAVTWRREILQ